jgi:arylsulfatase A-like enzyme
MKKTKQPKKYLYMILIVCVIAFSTVVLVSTFRKTEYNVVLIVVDTLRADHMSLYGYENMTTPGIDKFSENAVVFDNAHTAASWTLPSFASFLSSRHPRSIFYLPPGSEGNLLDSSGKSNIFTIIYRNITVLPEVLRENSYNTAAFATLTALKIPGFEKGFSAYDTQGMTVDKDPKRTRFMANGTAKELTRRVTDWIAQNKGSKFFVMMQYGDVHCPYVPPEEFNIYPPAKGENLSRYNCIFQFDNPNVTVTKEDVAAIRAAYDGNILYTDHYIGELLQNIKDMGLENNTIVVIMSDHGEELADHYDYLSHTESLSQSVAHVPLIIKYPGIKGARINATVGLLDVAPTILDLLEIPRPGEFEGRSLVPLIENRETDDRTQVFTAGPHWDMSYRGFALIENKSKYIEYLDQQKDELYNLSSDPKEKNNLAGQASGKVDEMKSTLLSFVLFYTEKSMQFAKLVPAGISHNVNNSKGLEDALKNLGYVA